jgi:DNA-binding NarL/FixJ family response regulator
MKKPEEKIKVMLASRPKMLSQVIRSMIDHQPDMQVIGEVIDPIELLNAAGAMPVDVVIITPLKVDEQPRLCSHLLNEFPRLKILILSVDGRAGFLYQSNEPKLQIDDPSEDSILNALRTSLLKACEQ